MIALVTGGGGFLGGALVRRLVERGDQVRSFSRQRYAALTALAVEQHQGDVADSDRVQKAVAGCDMVFHVAAKAGIWGRRSEYDSTNVLGTANVLAACRQHRVHRLVYTSSPSVVFSGRDQDGIEESTPYPAHYKADYPRTKAMAERAVLAANGPELATVALRPHLIWGPGDNYLVPRIVARAKAGRLHRIGRANGLIDSTCVDNAVDAHLLAADQLHPGAAIAGKVYFISNGEPLPVWELVNGILDAAGLPPVTRAVPYPVAIAAGWLLETAYAALGRQTEPPMTRFLAHVLTTAHWFDLSAARRDLGYSARVTIEQGMAELKQWFEKQHAEV